MRTPESGSQVSHLHDVWLGGFGHYYRRPLATCPRRTSRHRVLRGSNLPTASSANPIVRSATVSHAYCATLAPVAALVSTVRHAALAPDSFTADDVLAAIERDTARARARSQLSPRELEVVQLLAHGRSVAQISRALYISDSTTKTHIASVYEKLGVGNRAQVVMAAMRHGLIDLDAVSASGA